MEIYDREAENYDQWANMMEVLFAKGRSIFGLLKGVILEVGTGTGINLQYYNSEAQVIASDWSPRMVEKTRLRIKKLGLKNIKQVVIADIQALGQYFEPNTFDFVTSTCVFCSIPNPIKGLQEITKVLKPKGKLVQIEHGLSNFPFINIGLRILDPLTTRARGFHLARNTPNNLKIAGFQILHQILIDPAGIARILISRPSA
ncbi:MAG: class I SAM-dependent methyltransferase [Candidatus Helarchaeota archaeon]